MNAKSQVQSPESKLLAGRQTFRRAARFVAAAAKPGKFPAAQNKITNPLPV